MRLPRTRLRVPAQAPARARHDEARSKLDSIISISLCLMATWQPVVRVLLQISSAFVRSALRSARHSGWYCARYFWHQTLTEDRRRTAGIGCCCRRRRRRPRAAARADAAPRLRRLVLLRERGARTRRRDAAVRHGIHGRAWASYFPYECGGGSCSLFLTAH